jgi:hypothetical protein
MQELNKFLFQNTTERGLLEHQVLAGLKNKWFSWKNVYEGMKWLRIISSCKVL